MELLELMELEQRIKTLTELCAVQCSDGNWNYSSYMHGMANGMIFAVSLMKDRDTKYLDAPDEWLEDVPITEAGPFPSNEDIRNFLENKREVFNKELEELFVL
jgi:hypothetical protein